MYFEIINRCKYVNTEARRRLIWKKKTYENMVLPGDVNVDIVFWDKAHSSVVLCSVPVPRCLQNLIYTITQHTYMKTVRSC